MDRLACVNIPRLRLQLLGIDRPDWKSEPTAVVSEDKPLGTILEVNSTALEAGVRRGMRYATSLTLAPSLRAAVVDEDRLKRGRRGIAELLYVFSPHVEPADFDADIYWIDARGIVPLYRSFEDWARAVLTRLSKEGLVASVCVGFSRFGTYLAARRKRGVEVFSQDAEERDAVMTAPIRLLPLSGRTLETMDSLGIARVEEFLGLPKRGVRERFGRDAEEIYRFAHGELREPLVAAVFEEVLRREQELDHPTVDSSSFTERAYELLSELVAVVRARGEVVTSVHIDLMLENGSLMQETIRPAAPTARAEGFRKLFALRFEHVSLSSRAERIAVQLEHRGDRREQQDLFAEHAARDEGAARKLFSLVRAELGNSAVRWARLARSYLPERQFSWDLHEPPPETRSDQRAGHMRLVRRFYPKASSLSADEMARHVRVISGPFVFSSGWWDSYAERRYYYARAAERYLWIYFDETRKQWMLQGIVE